MTKRGASIPSVADIKHALDSAGHPYSDASMKPLTAILRDARLGQCAPNEAKAIINAMLVMAHHVNFLERKLRETQKHVSAGYVKRSRQ